jgi:dTDP-4-dehydrorhamnose reductase
MDILITGANGTLGKVLQVEAKNQAYHPIAWDRSKYSPNNPSKYQSLFEEYDLKAVIHLAIPSKNGEGHESLVHIDWPRTLGQMASHKGVPFIYTSTVMVFTHDFPGPYSLDSEPDEKEGYGYFKRRGEQTMLASVPNARVIRLGWQIGGTQAGNHMGQFIRDSIEKSGSFEASQKWYPASSTLEQTNKALIDLIKKPAGMYQFDTNHQAFTGDKISSIKSWSFYEIVESYLKQYHPELLSKLKVNNEFVYDQRMLDQRFANFSLNQELDLA